MKWSGDVSEVKPFFHVIISKLSLWVLTKCSFCLQTRGSIPFYWSQRPNLKYKPKPQISKTFNHVSFYSFYLTELISFCIFLMWFLVFFLVRWISETLWLAGRSLWKTSCFKLGKKPDLFRLDLKTFYRTDAVITFILWFVSDQSERLWKTSGASFWKNGVQFG